MLPAIAERRTESSQAAAKSKANDAWTHLLSYILNCTLCNNRPLIATIIIIRKMDERSTGPPDENGKFGDVYGYILPIQALCLSTP